MISRLSGLADEAGQDLETQIAAHQQLQWQHIELRNISGTPIDEIEGAQAKAVAQQLADGGLQVTGLASRIGNWQRTVDVDWAQEQAELSRLIEFSHLTGNHYIRIMSYLQGDYCLDAWRDHAIERIARFTELAQKGNVILLHENCTGWAGIDAQNTQTLLNEVSSPALKLLLDLGNGLAYRNSPGDFIEHCFESIAHIHIKDGMQQADGQVAYTFPGRGNVDLLNNLARLLKLGYQGVFAIEPHIDLIAHEGGRQLEDAGINSNYIAYGQSALELLQQAQHASLEKQTGLEGAVS